MTGLESKIFDYIEKTYEVTFSGKVEVIINGNEYTLNLVLNNYMQPINITTQAINDDKFYEFITKELGNRNLVQVQYFKLIKIDDGFEQKLR